jgi:hypothetical protein
MTPEAISLWSVGGALGSGWRLVVLWKRGRKWAHVLTVGDLKSHKVHLSEMGPVNVREVAVGPGHLATTLRRVRERLDACGVGYHRGTTEAIITTLEK